MKHSGALRSSHLRLTLTAALLAWSAACVGKGSEVGPKLQDFAEESVQGVVCDPTGRPVSNARVTYNGKSTFTDGRGRYRFGDEFVKSGLVRVDARNTSTDAGGIFDAASVFVNFTGTFGVPSRPIFLPDFQGGASQQISVNQGQLLAGTLVDPATGAELVLDGAVATLPGSAATSATIRFVSIPAHAVSAALTVGGVLRAGALYYAIAPAELVFSTRPAVRVGSSIFGIADALAASKPVAPELDHLDATVGDWLLAGNASVAGGFLTSPDTAGGGIFALSVASTAPRRTIVTARAVDLKLDALEKAAFLSRDGRSILSDSNGLAGIQDVTAADANDQPITVPLFATAPPFFAQHAWRLDGKAGVPGAGQVTDFGDRPLATVLAGRVRVQPIYRGDTLPGAWVGVADADDCLFEDSTVATLAGGEFWDVPLGRFLANATAIVEDGKLIRSSRLSQLTREGSTTTIQLFPVATAKKGKPHTGFIVESALRERSRTPVFTSYRLLGIDGSVAQQGYTLSGIGRFQPVLPGDALTTVGRAFETPARGLFVGGVPIDRIRNTTYASSVSDSRTRRALLSDRVELLPRGFAVGALASGTVAGLTDPIGTPPVSGDYSVEVRTSSAGSLEQKIAVELGLEEDAGQRLPERVALPAFAQPGYSTLIPAGGASLAFVERDGAGDTAPITRLGIVASVDASKGESVTQNASLDLVPSSSVQAVLSGFDGDAAAVRASLVVATPTGQGISLGRQGNATFNAGTGAFSVACPSLADFRVAAIVRGTGTTANGSSYETAAIVISDEAAPAGFLTLPTVTAPPPGGGAPVVLTPTGAGIEWAPDADADETLLTVERTDLETQPDGEIVEQRASWRVRLPGSPGKFIFPSLPAQSKGVPVPVFFESGKRYTLTIEARRYRAGAYEKLLVAASPEIATASFLGIRSLARTVLEFAVQ